jgi:hypothetical protein
MLVECCFENQSPFDTFAFRLQLSRAIFFDLSSHVYSNTFGYRVPLQLLTVQNIFGYQGTVGIAWCLLQDGSHDGRPAILPYV